LIARRLVGAILLAISATGCSLLPGPVIRTEQGVAPRMAPDLVESIALQHIRGMEQAVGHVAKPARIISMTATTAVGVARLEPGAGGGQPSAAGVEWLVRAEGTFTNERTPPGAAPMVATSGFFVISDADGSLVGFGFP